MRLPTIRFFTLCSRTVCLMFASWDQIAGLEAHRNRISRDSDGTAEEKVREREKGREKQSIDEIFAVRSSASLLSIALFTSTGNRCQLGNGKVLGAHAFFFFISLEPFDARLSWACPIPLTSFFWFSFAQRRRTGCSWTSLLFRGNKFNARIRSFISFVGT